MPHKAHIGHVRIQTLDGRVRTKGIFDSQQPATASFLRHARQVPCGGMKKKKTFGAEPE